MRSKFIVLILLSLFLINPIFAGEFLGAPYKDSPDFDGFTLAHMMKGAVTYTGFRIVGSKPLCAIGWAAFGAFAYEYFIDGLDILGIGKGIRADTKADFIGDLSADIIGAGLACCVEAAIKSLTKKEVKTFMVLDKNKKKVGIIIPIE